MGSSDKEARETARFLDNLTDFISSKERDLTEIRDSLQAQGIDPDESLREFRDLLSEHAPTWKEKASRERAAIAESLESAGPKTHRSLAEIKDEIWRIVESIRSLGVPVEAGAYHRKFEEAQEEDLESLLQDLRFQRDRLLKRRERSDPGA